MYKETVTITNKASNGDLLQAVFLPQKGMNLISFKRADIEVIDPSTQAEFEERFAGLGALIGPHFHRKQDGVIPKIPDENLFPHVGRVKVRGINDPFSHGIARYAPWISVKQTEQSISGTLTGKDLWNGVLLSTLEGQNFKMLFDAEMTAEGLSLKMSIVSDTDSLVGIHYYYRLPGGKGVVTSKISDSGNHEFRCDLSESVDANFHPFPNPLQGEITLTTDEYQLITKYQNQSQENSWQLYHPKDASFVCIEPLSAQDPRHPNLTVSSIAIQLSILPP